MTNKNSLDVIARGSAFRSEVGSSRGPVADIMEAAPLFEPHMGLFFTLLYVVTAYLSPTTVFGELALYHVEVGIVIIALLLTIFSAQGSGVLTWIQTWAIVGLCTSVVWSIVFIVGVRGSSGALIDFLPNITGFFLVALNCKKKWHLQLLVGLLFGVIVFIVYQAHAAIASGAENSLYVLNQGVDEDAGISIARIRGLSFLGDPNDLGQFMVSLIPCLFFFWAKNKSVRNLFLVYLPAVFVIYAMYLTHSRGGMLALMVVAIVASRRKVGVVPALIAGAVLFAGLSAAGFSGGREVSVGAGEDRMDAWSTGLDLIRSKPVFGVGYKQFGEYNNITAHNTFVVCAAELGLVGAFCWVLFVLVTIRNVYQLAEVPAKATEPEELPPGFPANLRLEASPPAAARHAAPAATLSPAHLFGAPMPAFALSEGKGMLGSAPPGFRETGFPEAGFPDGQESEEELRRLANLMVISFAGFLTAGWFLSRSYTLILYVNAGMAAAIYQMAVRRGVDLTRIPVGRAMKVAGILVVILLIVVYGILRVDHLISH
jgi:O-antigen ligase